MRKRGVVTEPERALPRGTGQHGQGPAEEKNGVAGPRRAGTMDHDLIDEPGIALDRAGDQLTADRVYLRILPGQGSRAGQLTTASIVFFSALG
jgi:hypothetical protein